MSFKISDRPNNEAMYKLLTKNNYLLNDYYKNIIDKESYVENTINCFINDDFKIVKSILKDNELQGLYSLERLDWDSKVFGRNMWKMKLILNSSIQDDISNLKTEFLRECKKLNINHISCQVKSRDNYSTDFLEQIGFKIKDAIIRFGINLENYNVENKGNHSYDSIRIRSYKDTDYHKVMNIVEEAFNDYPNRFRNDNSFTKEQCKKFYLEWASNSMKGFADLVIVAEAEDRILGFSTLKTKRIHNYEKYMITERQISGVAKASRGLGLNYKMLKEQLLIASKNSTFFEVGTQIYNYVSQRTYYKCGLKPFDSYFSFHMSL